MSGRLRRIVGVYGAGGLALIAVFSWMELVDTEGVIFLLFITAMVAAGWVLAGRGEAAAVPWGDRSLVEEPPEEPRDEDPLSGTGLASALDRAVEEAHRSGTLEAGAAVVRPLLRTTLERVLVAGGASEREATAAIDDGTWTDDSAVAALLAPTAGPVEEGLASRILVWLVPGRVLRERVHRAVDAIDQVAETTVPQVPGQTTPRSVTVEEPRVGERVRTAEGELHPPRTEGEA